MSTVILAALLAPALAQALPPAPEKPRPTPATTPDDPPSFGSDVAVGYAVGALMGAWPNGGLHGVVLGRYDAFARSKHQGGARLGLSLWGSWTVGPLQDAVEDEALHSFKFQHYGAMGIIRHDPQAPVGAAAGIGFGVLELEDYWGGPHTLPTLSFELGPRIKVRDPAFVDVLIRAHHATARSATDPTALHEWWGAHLLIEVGGHAI